MFDGDLEDKNAKNQPCLSPSSLDLDFSNEKMCVTIFGISRMVYFFLLKNAAGIDE